MFNGNRVSVLQDEKVLAILHKNVNILNTTVNLMLHALKHTHTHMN